MNHTRSRIAAALLIAAFIMLAAAWSVITPIYETPDEPGHIDYIAFIVLQHALPVQSTTKRNYAHHPPLYYAAAALATAAADWTDLRDMPTWTWLGTSDATRARHRTAESFPWRGRVLAVHIARGVSIATGATAVAFTIAIGWMLFPGRRSIGILAGALLAFTPQFVFVSAAVSNDAAAAAAGAAVLWAMLRAWRSPNKPMHWSVLGLLCGAALLTKSTTLSIVGMACFTWAASMRRFDTQRTWLTNGARAFAAAAAVSGWWFVRNVQIYTDPLGWSAYRIAWADMIRTAPLPITDIPQLLGLQWSSYWGLFGWLSVDPGRWLDICASALLATAVIGWLRLRRTAARFTALQRTSIRLCTVTFLLHQAYLGAQNILQNEVMAQGRLLFPASAAAMTLTAVGLLAILDAATARRAALTISLAAAAAAIGCLAFVIEPTYRMVALPKRALLGVPHQVEATFGNLLHLRGYAQRTRITADEATLTVRLYWQALRQPDFDYAVFVDALDANGTLLARHYQVPGRPQRFAPSSWQPGDLVDDEWALTMPAADLRRVRTLRIGAYDWRNGAVLTTADGAAYVLAD